MNKHLNSEAENKYWSQFYIDERTGWDLGNPSPPLKEYIDQLSDRSISILIPGAGNAYEAEYLFERGFQNVHVLDISEYPIRNFQKRVPDFPKENLIQANFFKHEGDYDLILEHTFFCTFQPTKENRVSYAEKAAQILKPGGKLVGLWFDFPLTGDMEKRPFGGSKEEYLSYFATGFEVITFERCYNSYYARAGFELFGIFRKK